MSENSSWCNIVKNNSISSKLKIKNYTNEYMSRLIENYIKYGIIDHEILDYTDEHKLQIFAEKARNEQDKEEESEELDIQSILNENKALNKRNSELNIEVINMQLMIKSRFREKKKIQDLEKYIKYLEDFADRLLIENYQEPLFFDNSVNIDNYEYSDTEDENTDFLMIHIMNETC